MKEMKRVPLTQDAFDRLQIELEHLEGEGRQKVIDDIATARAHGDLSENAEYHAAREQQGMHEARARQVRAMLENAEIVSVVDDGEIRPGMLVTLRYESDDEAETYLLGLREEKGGEHDVLTPDSPLGQALLGRTAGDKVSAAAPAGEIKVEIIDVKVP